jgi:hypothetical protein
MIAPFNFLPPVTSNDAIVSKIVYCKMRMPVQITG